MDAQRAAALGLAALGLFLAPVGAAAALSLWAGWVHLGLRLVGRGKGGWAGSVRAVGYSAGLGLIAAYPTGWALAAALVWVFAVQAIGLMTVHRIGFFRLAAGLLLALIGTAALVSAALNGLVLLIGHWMGG